jgi:hypothetical protein
MANVVTRQRLSVGGCRYFDAKGRAIRTASPSAALAFAALIGRAPTLHGQSVFAGIETPIVVAASS